jgi:translation initiation factor 1A
MPKGNQKGGKKHKRNKNFTNENKSVRIKEEGQEYAKVSKCKGNCRFDVECCDGKTRAAILCGGMRKRKFINQGDVVLVSIREWQDSICDIIDSYDESQAKKLKQEKHIPESFKLGEDNPYGDLNDDIDFVSEMPPSDESSSDSSDSEVDLDDI